MKNQVCQAMGPDGEKYNCRNHDLSDFDTFRGGWRRVYICGPQGNGAERETEAALMCCRFAVSHQCVPVAPQLYYFRFLNDFDYRERRLEMKFRLKDLKCCDEVWVFGERISEGMEKELTFAARKGKHIRWFTNTEINEVMINREEDEDE